MKHYLRSFALFDVVDGTTECPPNDKVEQRLNWLLRDGKALGAICLGVEEGQRVHVDSYNTAKGAWDNLSKTFQRTSLSEKIRLRHEFYCL